MTSVFRTMGEALKHHPTHRIIVEKTNVKMWTVVSLPRLRTDVWYDYLDIESGTVGQCNIESLPVQSEADDLDPNWLQAPKGWRSVVKELADAENLEDDQIEQLSLQIYEHNNRYQFLDYCGEAELQDFK